MFLNDFVNKYLDWILIFPQAFMFMDCFWKVKSLRNCMKASASSWHLLFFLYRWWYEESYWKYDARWKIDFLFFNITLSPSISICDKSLLWSLDTRKHNKKIDKKFSCVGVSREVLFKFPWTKSPPRFLKRELYRPRLRFQDWIR